MKQKPNNDWLAALESAMEQSADKPGKEWLTRTALAIELDLGESATDRAIKRMLAAGAAESKTFTIMHGGQRRHIPHFRLL